MLKKDISNIPLRVQPELREWIRAEAKKHCRTMNAEMTFILEQEKARRADTQQALDLVTTNAN